ncbi:unnamed protein product [Clonostachys byssicola]|uniref:Uncharacterized protein n=1 Tax=Clonostachys byssicola TaxID=160290 RepID=A0A9N9UFE8_9HYPO|nr:unnamed protein product [Clonostachys byssicola]
MLKISVLSKIPGVTSYSRISTVLELLLGGQLEKVLPNGELLIDLLLAEAKVYDVEETDLLQSLEQLVGESLFASRLVELGQIKRYQISPIHYDWSIQRTEMSFI